MVIKSLGDTLEDFELIGNDVQTMTFLPRAIELQEEAAAEAEAFLERLAKEKADHVAAKTNEAANTILALELGLRTGLDELKMWIHLKRDQPEEAWDSLISAQYTCQSAIEVRRQLLSKPSTEGLENLLQNLLLIEHLVFPPQMFSSVGGVAQRRECSICHQDYEECDHIKGRAYLGELCHTILQKMNLREVSIVTNPANKRCRLSHFSDKGKMRNKMTWRLEDR